MVIALGTGLRSLSVDTSVGSLVPAGDSVVEAWQDTQASFGGDPVVVLFRGEGGGDLLGPEPIGRLVALEGELARLPDVAVVYGPGTALNQIAIQVNQLLVTVTARRDGLRSEAESTARARGASEVAAQAAGDEAVAAYEARYGSLVVAGLPLGLPTLHNPGFARGVFLDDEGRARPPLRWIVPDGQHAAVYVRPRENLDQDEVERLVTAVRSKARQAGIGTAGIGTGVTVTGAPVVAASLGAEVRRELPRVGFAALVAVAAAFLLTHRVGAARRKLNPRRLLPFGLGLLATALVLAGFGLAGVGLSLGMLAFLPVMLGVGSDLPIQAAHPARPRTFWAAALAGAAAFAALALSPLPFVRHLGLSLAAGVLISAALASAGLNWLLPANRRCAGPENGPLERQLPGQPAGYPAGQPVRPQSFSRPGAVRRAGLAGLGLVAVAGWIGLPSLPRLWSPSRRQLPTPSRKRPSLSLP